MKTLDDDIRTAFAALDGTTPEGYFDDFADRVDQRLEVEAMGPEMTTGMSSDSGNDMPPMGNVKGREENTGLHDIKEMAKVRKEKISKRHSTQSDAEESLLNSASSASLAAVVLPTPGKDDAKYETEESPAVAAAASTSSVGAAASSVPERTGMPVWVYGAVLLAAAAGVVFFLTRGGADKDDKVAAADMPAATDSGDTATQGAPPASPTVAPIPEDPAVPAIADDSDDGAEAEEASATAADPAAKPGEADADGDSNSDKGATSDKPVAVASRTKKSRKADRASKPKTSSSSSKASASAPKKPAKAKKPAASDGKRSLDDLLDEAAGGAKSNKDIADEVKKEEAKPSKTELTRSDIKSGMGKILGRVGGCHDKFKVSGNVMVKVVVAPSGEVASAKATGKFKNTDTGLCVANAVKKAKFPAWSGSRKSFSYPFLLSQ